MDGPAPPRPATTPHPPLTAYYAGEADREAFVRRIFDDTAPDYDRVERAMAFGTGPWYRRQALLRAGLAPGMRVLDVGIGTGLVAREVVAIVGDATRVIGVDPSAGMLRAASVPTGVELRVGGAEALPAEDAGFDFLSMGFALRHVPDLAPAFAEFHRVLRPGGRLCLLEITRPQSRTATLALKAYLRGVVPVLARLVGRTRDMPALMRYYWDTIEACVPPGRVLELLREAGFERVDRHVELGVFSEYRAMRPGAST
jgi:demethylmenaquinone methyltransferase/2-methoxy-6-polyprenyl-1,4-benzoquinol methylase